MCWPSSRATTYVARGAIQPGWEKEAKADQGDSFGAFATFKELRNRGASVTLGR